MPAPQTYYTVLASPIGDLLLIGDGARLTGLYLSPHTGACPTPGADWTRDDAPFAAAASQLSAYFGGERRTFDLPHAARGTPFQHKVWQALTVVPYGQTVSYAQLATRIDQPRAVRAVGRANSSNPLPIVVPCHRVVGSSGALTGYGGGIDLKRWLLAFEAETAARAVP